MRTIGWIALAMAGACAAFGAGVLFGGARRPRVELRELMLRSEERKPDARGMPVVPYSVEGFRRALAEEQKEVERLRAQLAELGLEPAAPYTPEEERRKRQDAERRACDIRWWAACDLSNDLTTKIVQRRDKVLRQEGLDELYTLLRSTDRDQLLLGLAASCCLRAVNCDKGRFKDLVLATLNHPETEMRRAALMSVHGVCSDEEAHKVFCSMAADPSYVVRRWVADRIAWTGSAGTDEDLRSALRSLLSDEDAWIKFKVLDDLSKAPECEEEMVDLAMELSRDDRYADQALSWLSGRRTIGAKVANRLIELYDEGRKGSVPLMWSLRSFSDDARPIVSQFFLRILRESLNQLERGRAAETLRIIGDASLLRELEEIARGPDAEGIEEQLAKTIEQLRQKRSQER